MGRKDSPALGSRVCASETVGTDRWGTDLQPFPTSSRLPQVPLVDQRSADHRLMAEDLPCEGRIAVVYDHGDPPPEITILRTAGNVQTVLANGVAVAIVACADGPDLAAEDVMLVERFRT